MTSKLFSSLLLPLSVYVAVSFGEDIDSRIKYLESLEGFIDDATIGKPDENLLQQSREWLPSLDSDTMVWPQVTKMHQSYLKILASKEGELCGSDLLKEADSAEIMIDQPHFDCTFVVNKIHARLLRSFSERAQNCREKMYEQLRSVRGNISNLDIVNIGNFSAAAKLKSTWWDTTSIGVQLLNLRVPDRDVARAACDIVKSLTDTRPELDDGHVQEEYLVKLYDEHIYQPCFRNQKLHKEIILLIRAEFFASPKQLESDANDLIFNHLICSKVVAVSGHDTARNVYSIFKNEFSAQTAKTIKHCDSERSEPFYSIA